MRVSFDFDGTLTQSEIKEYAKFLIGKQVDVFIVTGRYNDLVRKMNGSKSNDDVFDLADEIGLLHRNIIFTNRTDKSYTLGGSGLIWHLDDDINAVQEIVRYTDVKAIWTGDSQWKTSCQAMLKL